MMLFSEMDGGGQSPYLAISGVNGFVCLSTFCIHKLPIDEQLVGHVDGHVVYIPLHLFKGRKIRNWAECEGVPQPRIITTSSVAPSHGDENTYIVHHQLLFHVLPAQLPHTHLDELLEGCGHVDVLVLKLKLAGPQLYLLHQPDTAEQKRQMSRR